jgi:hypothetical protein
MATLTRNTITLGHTAIDKITMPTQPSDGPSN